MSEVNVSLKLVKEFGFIGRTKSNYAIVLKAPEVVVEKPLGPSPMELVLVALAGCTAYDIISILSKMRQRVEGLEIHVKAKQREEPPRVYTDIHLDYIIFGDVDEDKVVKAIQLSQEKYCSVSLMLKHGGVNVTTSYEVKR
ncbi:MAG: OsmC family peroxiredoxin [Candidatus Methanomethylicota archaeon]|uniref:OsmC family peroxiredoxin n=1 Tax=Thermoproteota archaeon TaxID=2056631 RepID=A0A497F4C3_9CREN|nr:MAG: OsmC family peroxiredoxin [Candidatus Verstraetearchaeota archaeon]